MNWIRKVRVTDENIQLNGLVQLINENIIYYAQSYNTRYNNIIYRIYNKYKYTYTF